MPSQIMSVEPDIAAIVNTVEFKTDILVLYILCNIKLCSIPPFIVLYPLCLHRVPAKIRIVYGSGFPQISVNIAGNFRRIPNQCLNILREDFMNTLLFSFTGTHHLHLPVITAQVFNKLVVH